MLTFLIGLCLITAMIGLFWLKDKVERPWLTRLAYSQLVARLAVLGAALSVIGMLLILS